MLQPKIKNYTRKALQQLCKQIRTIQKEINKSKIAWRRVKDIRRKLNELNLSIKQNTQSKEYQNIVDIRKVNTLEVNILEIKKVEIPKYEQILKKREETYEKTVFFTIPNTIGLYIQFFAYIREYFSYILLHMYIALFVLSLFCEKVKLTITFCQFTGGYTETFCFIIILLILICSYGYRTTEEPIFKEHMAILFQIAVGIKVYLGIYIFRQFLIGKPLLYLLLSNHIFTFAVDSVLTCSFGISYVTIPVIPTFNGILEDIPTITYFP